PDCLPRQLLRHTQGSPTFCDAYAANLAPSSPLRTSSSLIARRSFTITPAASSPSSSYPHLPPPHSIGFRSSGQFKDMSPVRDDLAMIVDLHLLRHRRWSMVLGSRDLLRLVFRPIRLRPRARRGLLRSENGQVEVIPPPPALLPAQTHRHFMLLMSCSSLVYLAVWTKLLILVDPGQGTVDEGTE
ncbi:hypothetical protein CF319_g8331, partial [Tilletia indica]